MAGRSAVSKRIWGNENWGDPRVSGGWCGRCGGNERRRNIDQIVRMHKLEFSDGFLRCLVEAKSPMIRSARTRGLARRAESWSSDTTGAPTSHSLRGGDEGHHSQILWYDSNHAAGPANSRHRGDGGWGNRSEYKRALCSTATA